ncbi:MAG TPA: ROK family transcriptional regulator, partial [Pseudonocardia sp.]|nr:ROK family transcriptional regulator [Pseudonocardia sp.]
NGRRPLDAHAVRQGNLALVLDAVVRSPPTSQPELVQATGLKKATVSRLLEELVRLGWVRAAGAAAGLVGRPRVLFEPDPALGLVVGARISIEGVSGLVVDFGGRERARGTHAVDVRGIPQPEVAATLARTLGELLDGLGADHPPVVGAALAVSGVVDAGVLGYTPGLDWPDRDVAGMLRAALDGHLADGAPLLVDNDTRFAAVGEQRYGVAAGVGDFVHLLGDLGVGGGVVVDGRLFRGTRGAAGEVGHVSVALDGPRCRCGKVGCWATFVGRDELAKHAQAARDAGRASTMWSAPLTPDGVLAAARLGDEVAQECVATVRRYLAAGIGNLVSVYDPELVVLGGFLGAAFGDELPALRAEIDDWLMGGGAYTDVRLETSRVPDAPLWGGAWLVHERLIGAPRADARLSRTAP